MARPRKDKFEETSIRFEKGTEHEIVHVSIPFWINVTFKTPVGKGENGKIYYGTHTQVWKESAFDEKLNKKEFQKKGMEVIIRVSCRTVHHRWPIRRRAYSAPGCT